MKFLKRLRDRLWLTYDKTKTGAIGYLGSTATLSTWNRYPRIAHFASRTLALLMALDIPANFISPHTYEPLRLVVAVFTTATELLFLVGIQHRGFLCEYCIGEFPLDGQQQATKHHGLLHAYHFRVKWFIADWVISLVMSLAGTSIGLTNIQLGVVLSVLDLPLIYAFGRVMRTHDKLQVFCPYCNGNGGGGDRAVTPDPSEMIPA